jgi:DNA-directed RNA polymerase subunit beta
LRSLGLGTNQEILDLFGDEPKIMASFGKDVATNYQEGLLELYKKIRPGEPLAVESAESLINAMFFDPRRYDLAKVGRYKFNKKLMLRNRIRNRVLAEDVVDPNTGEILAEAGTVVSIELADRIQNAAVPYVVIQCEERNVRVLSNMMVDITSFVDCDPKELGITELVYYPALREILERQPRGGEIGVHRALAQHEDRALLRLLPARGADPADRVRHVVVPQPQIQLKVILIARRLGHQQGQGTRPLEQERLSLGIQLG